MKIWKFFPLLAAVVTFAGCASLEAPNTEDLLSAAGFTIKIPETPKQKAFYNALPAFQVQSEMVKGQPIYVYADKKDEVVYFGTPQNYQKYRQLALKQQIAEDKLDAAEMQEDAALDWDTWGPWSDFWD